MALSDRLAEKTATSRARIEVDSTGATVTDVPVEGALDGDWGALIRHFGLDPDAFEVVDDTVRMSTWEQSARGKDGSRDKVQLWSYSARFRKIRHEMIRPEVLQRWRDDLTDWTPDPVSHVEQDHTYLVLVADPQLGKKGTQEAVENWRRGVSAHVRQIRALKPARVHVAFMGDETEGACNNYANQPHTIELNQSQQLELDFDMRVWTMKQVLATGLPVSASSVISNHGEWTRNGSKDPVTSSNDNASTHIARMTQRLFHELGHDIEWTIGETHPGITLTLGGVECYFSHGYKEKGRGTSTETRTRAAIERQILGRTEELGTTKLWFMAHYHHFYTQEFEGRTLFGCPALEAERSSEYMLDQYGVWSPPGMLGMLVGGSGRGWQNANVF